MSQHRRGGWDFSPAAASPPGGLRAAPPVGTTRRGIGAGEIVRRIVAGTGELLITVGAVLVLFALYEVKVSNVFADHNQAVAQHKLTQAWSKGQDPLHGQDKLNLPAGKQVVLPAGQGFANLYIPAFGKDYAKTVIQGTDDADLNEGPGHYIGTQVPGQLGNFAMAGHRVGKGEPFLNLDQLHPGDKIVVQTASNWYIYTVLGSQPQYQAALKLHGSARSDAIAAALAATDAQGVPGREIVSPSAVQVIAPVPDHPGETPTRALLTMTTCHPKYTANQRMVIHAVLTRAVKASGSALPKELAGGTL